MKCIVVIRSIHRTIPCRCDICDKLSAVCYSVKVLKNDSPYWFDVCKNCRETDPDWHYKIRERLCKKEAEAMG